LILFGRRQAGVIDRASEGRFRVSAVGQDLTEVDLAPRGGGQIAAHELHRLVHYVHLAQEQLARPDQTQRDLNRLHRSLYLANLFDPLAVGQPFAEDGHDLPRLAATDAVGVLVQNDAVESVAQQIGLADQVLVAPVAGRGVDRRALAGRELSQYFDEARQGRYVVAVIHDDGGPPDFQQVEAAGRLVEAAAERLQPRADLFARHAEAPCRGGRRQDVLDLEPDAAAVRQRHQPERHQ